MVEKTSSPISLSPAQQPQWDETEAVLLHNIAERVANGSVDRTEAVNQLSRVLRMRLAARGGFMDEKTRNFGGVNFQLRRMEQYIASGATEGVSKLFMNIVNLRKENPRKYDLLLRKAEEELNELCINILAVLPPRY